MRRYIIFKMEVREIELVGDFPDPLHGVGEGAFRVYADIHSADHRCYVLKDYEVYNSREEAEDILRKRLQEMLENLGG